MANMQTLKHSPKVNQGLRTYAHTLCKKQSLEHIFKGGQGLGSYAQTVVCLHLAANQAGTAVDSKAMAKVPVFELYLLISKT